VAARCPYHGGWQLAAGLASGACAPPSPVIALTFLMATYYGGLPAGPAGNRSCRSRERRCIGGGGGG